MLEKWVIAAVLHGMKNVGHKDDCEALFSHTLFKEKFTVPACGLFSGLSVKR